MSVNPARPYGSWPTPISAQRNLTWLKGQGITIPEDHIATWRPCTAAAPSPTPNLLNSSTAFFRPQHIIVTVGGGTQERLRPPISKRNLTCRPAIHCIGAAIAFLSGDQIHIPVWADRFYLGWLLRSLSEPKRYIPRYLDAFQLFPLAPLPRSASPTSET